MILTGNITTKPERAFKGICCGPVTTFWSSSMEHNAVMRPLVQLSGQDGSSFDRIPCTSGTALMILWSRPRSYAQASHGPGYLVLSSRLQCMRHPSCLPAELGRYLPGTRHLLFIPGRYCPDCRYLSTWIWKHFQIRRHWLLPVHKGLRGPQGTGGFLISRTSWSDQMEPLTSAEAPAVLPTQKRFRLFCRTGSSLGTPNLPGILGPARST